MVIGGRQVSNPRSPELVGLETPNAIFAKRGLRLCRRWCMTCSRADIGVSGYDVGMGKRLIRTKWLDGEREAFADGLRFRAVRFQDRRKQTVKFLCRYTRRFRDED